MPQRQKLRVELSAFSRAVSMSEPQPSQRSGDALAALLLPPSLRVMAAPALRQMALRWLDQIAPGLYGYLVASTQYVDRLIEERFDPEPRQVVILGAGFDTRALRLAALGETCSVFEVDHRAILAAKQQRLRRHGVRTDGVRYVEADLLRDPVPDVLMRAGYCHSQRTMFVWMGITPFMAHSAIRATLWLVSHAAPGSTLIFDYACAETLNRLGERAAAPQLLDALARRGQRIVGAIDTQEVPAFLEPFGIEVRSIAGGAALRKACFGIDAGAVAVTELFGIVCAERIDRSR